MDIKVTFPGNKKVDAHFDGFTVHTDQPAPSGDGTAPAPFDLFLASLATCAGVYASGFCAKRNISTESLTITQHAEWNETKKMYTMITIEIGLPKGFPPQYREALINSVNLCTVKKHLMDPPQFEVKTVG